MALRIDYIEPSDLRAYANNSRTHSETQVDQIVASITEFGFVNPILIGEDNTVIAGHGRLMAATQMGLDTVPVIRLTGLSERQRRALVIADNKIAMNAGWDFAKLGDELSELINQDFDLGLTGFNEQEIDALLKEDMQILPEEWGAPEQIEPERIQVSKYTRVAPQEGNTEDDAVPEVAQAVVSQPGDVWILGRHRVMCGDSTRADDVATLMDGGKATLLHADPPYGMGKQSEGVANDNIYREKLDAFQMEWWKAFRPSMVDNASAYIWGNAEDLWRLWFRGGLADSEFLELRNEIVWDKKNIAGMKSELQTAYQPATERCLFIQFGEQFLRNVNSDEFPEAWEKVRGYMGSQADAAGVTPTDVKRICGVGMYSHWFTKSQFTLIPERHYRALSEAYPGYFTKPWREIKAEWDEVKTGPRSAFAELRSYFDNGHDIMRDVWEFPRVFGDDRLGHATPKPVAMIERCVMSSSRPGDVVIEPFGGSGPTLIACEKLQRSCRMMELVPSWVDVIVKRWQDFTGEEAVHVSGYTFEEMNKQRN